MLKKITRMTAVAAVLTATAIAAPSAGAESALPAGIDAGLGPSSGSWLRWTQVPRATAGRRRSWGRRGGRRWRIPGGS